VAAMGATYSRARHGLNDQFRGADVWERYPRSSGRPASHKGPVPRPLAHGGEPDEARPREIDRDIEAIAPAAEQAFDVADA
jgi:hypothetical protein